MCIRDRNSGDMMTKNSEEIIYEVSDSYKNQLISSSDKIVENGVLKGDTVGNSDDNERVNSLEVIDGIVISIDAVSYTHLIHF